MKVLEVSDIKKHEYGVSKQDSQTKLQERSVINVITLSSVSVKSRN